MDPRSSGFLRKFKANRFISTLTIAITLAVGILIGTVVSHGVKGKEQQANTSADAQQLQIPPAPSPQQLSSTFSVIAKQLEPSVVNINTESTVKPPSRRRGMPGGGQGDQGGEDPFQDFFNRFFGGPGGGPGGQIGPDGVPQDLRERALGSGVIVDPRGYIVTNNHVVQGADHIRVHLTGEPEIVQHDAKVIGTDLETDLAVIKIDVKRELPVAKLGNSDAEQVGDWVLAIGSPFGLNSTVTAGIVSAKGRNIVPRRQFQSMIQTDAAINPGNSGGPLVNMRGEVVGINTAIYTESNGYQGVGFAMPSNVVIPVYDQLIGPEHVVTRGSIGVEFNAVANPAVARIYGVTTGITVASVSPGGPADQAGIKTGDTITSVNGKTVKDGDQLVSEISGIKPGTKATLGYVRNGKQGETAVTIANRAKLYANRLGDESEIPNNGQPQESKLGVTVGNVTPDIADRLGIAPNKGVIVQDVKPGTFADEDANLSRGDIILEVNKKPVNSVEEFRITTSGLKSGDDVVFLIHPPREKAGVTVFAGGTLP